MKNIIYLLLILTLNKSYSQVSHLNRGGIMSVNYYEEIDFEFIRNKIVIPVQIKGKTYRFVLDTGAPNVLSKELADVIQPALLDSISIRDANGNKGILNTVSLDSFQLGNLTFEHTAALVFDLSTSPVFGCFGIDGLIGSNVLRNSIISIDAKNKKLIITDQEAKLSLKKKEAEKIDLSKNQSSPYLWLRLRGKDHAREQVLIDTGADGLYDLAKKHYEIFQKQDIFSVSGESEGASTFGIFGGGSKNKQYKLVLPVLEINDIQLTRVVTNTMDDNESRIGARLLEYGVMIIDYKNKRFYFKAYSKTVPAAKPDYGFSQTLNGNKLIVGFVWDEQLKSRLKYGDEITEMNHVVINESSLCDLVVGKLDFPDQHTIVLKIKTETGEEFELSIDKKLPPKAE